MTMLRSFFWFISAVFHVFVRGLERALESYFSCCEIASDRFLRFRTFCLHARGYTLVRVWGQSSFGGAMGIMTFSKGPKTIEIFIDYGYPPHWAKVPN